MLTNRQKSILAQLANRAFRLECAKSRGRGEVVDSSSAAAEVWRHDQVAKACGKFGLRCCGPDDYKPIEAHFLDMLGEAGRAFNTHIIAQSNPRRIADYKLREACREFGYDISYAATICKTQFKCSLGEASDTQLWNLMFTIRNRGRAKQKVTTNE
jgi:hypothetical protein